MVTIWIGDFRIRQLQKLTKATQQTAKYYFLTDDAGDALWFNDSVLKQLSMLHLDNANIIIALGFLDCVYSCISQKFNIDELVNSYNGTVSAIKAAYPNFNIYFCSVNPVESGYYLAKTDIDKNTLSDKIKYFNDRIKENTNIKFVDSYSYLTGANYATRDGVYLTSASCKALLDFIKTATGYDAIISKEGLCTANSYNITVTDMQPNARYIYQYLRNAGWSLNAIAGMLGNIQVESKMSPWMWQGAIEGSIINDDESHSLNKAVLGDSSPGYGLVQWTPYTKYIEWCTERNLAFWDIDSQLKRICWEVENNEQWQSRPSKGYDLSFNDFITSTKDADWLGCAFAFCYERPGSSTGTEDQQNDLKIERGNNATYWYEYLSTFNFESEQEPTEQPPIPQANLKTENIFTCKLNTSIDLIIK